MLCPWTWREFYAFRFSIRTKHLKEESLFFHGVWSKSFHNVCVSCNYSHFLLPLTSPPPSLHVFNQPSLCFHLSLTAPTYRPERLLLSNPCRVTSWHGEVSTVFTKGPVDHVSIAAEANQTYINSVKYYHRCVSLTWALGNWSSLLFCSCVTLVNHGWC